MGKNVVHNYSAVCKLTKIMFGEVGLGPTVGPNRDERLGLHGMHY